MMYLTIGSGDVRPLLSGLHTKGYSDLWRKFTSDSPPHYNAFASPIDALRTGAILETAYLQYLPADYFSQVKTTCQKMDVLTASIDFAKIQGGKIVDFDELKTIYLTDYLSIVRSIAEVNDEPSRLKSIKKKFKTSYQQVQFQLLCTGLDSANLVFMSVETYDDFENEIREISDNDVTKFRIPRDPEVIDFIVERAAIFQAVKKSVTK